MEDEDKKTRMKSLIAFGFGSSDTGFSLYWSDNAMKTLEKRVYEQSSLLAKDPPELPED